MSSNIEINRVCEYCSKVFLARTTVTRYCSHRCNSRVYKIQQRKKKIRMSNIDSKKQLLNNESSPNINNSRQTYFNIKELAIITNVSERTLYRLIKNEFPKVKIGRRLLFNREKVINHIESKYSGLLPAHS